MKNKLTEILGIHYPIIQGGMIDISLSKLAAAVSNAGGLGTLGQMADIRQWHDEIKKTRELTNKAFAVNLGLYMTDLRERLDIILTEGVKIVVTGGGNPSIVLKELKDAGILSMHVVSTSEQAKKIEAMGVDIIIAEGGESGGLVSKNIVSTLVLVPLVVDAVSVPVIAAGGIGDARGFVACLALGAQGVQMGTVFEASEESGAPGEWKAGIIAAKEFDTTITDGAGLRARVIKEDVCQGGIMTGQIAGMVHAVEETGDIMKRMVGTVNTVFKRIEFQLTENNN